MDWHRIAPDFEPDGSLRDIYILRTDLADWQHVLDALGKWTPAPTLILGGQSASLPVRAEKMFSGDERPLLSILVGGATLNCHFFTDDEIEFDVNPAEVTGPSQAEALTAFMTVLGEATNKPVVLTMENSREGVIFRYSPDLQRVEWVSH
jgi:hypothetical protein